MCFIIAYPLNVLSQTKPFSAAEIDRMTMTYTYYIAQQASIESITERFPQLTNYATDASKQFIKEFQASLLKIDSNLRIINGKNWETEKVKQYEKYRKADNSNVSEKEARQFIDNIFQRSYGKIQSPVLETLLAFKPEYNTFPEKEFSDAYVNTYLSAKPNKKKTDINIRIIYPKSWIAIPGKYQSNIQQIFISKYGAGQMSMSLLSERTSNTPIEKPISLLSENNLRKYCLKNDSIISYSSGIDIDNCPASKLIFFRTELDIDKKYYILNETYHGYYKNYHLALTFRYKSYNGNLEVIKTEFEKYRKLIRKIMFNVVILSQWEQKKM
jgi:hypothetical protein